MWRSTDGGNTWHSLFTADGRTNSPVVLNQALDGTPFLTTNIMGYHRNIMEILPLNSSRTGLDKPITLRNGPVEFGPAPKGRGWGIDHGIGNVIRLADGNWHSILIYRVRNLSQ